MRLRQVALVAEKLAPVRQQLFTLLGLTADFKDPGVGEFGLENSVMVLGDTFLEVVSPAREGTTAGRLLANRGGDGGYMLLLQIDEFERYRDHTEALGLRKVWSTDRKQVRAFHLHPKDIGATIVSLDWMDPPAAWEWGGPDWPQRAAQGVGNITAVDIQADDPAALAEHWAKVLMRPVDTAGAVPRLVLDQGVINFVPVADGRGAGVGAVEVATADLAALSGRAEALGLAWQDGHLLVCGTRFRFVEAL